MNTTNNSIADQLYGVYGKHINISGFSDALMYKISTYRWLYEHEIENEFIDEISLTKFIILYEIDQYIDLWNNKLKYTSINRKGVLNYIYTSLEAKQFHSFLNEKNIKSLTQLFESLIQSITSSSLLANNTYKQIFKDSNACFVFIMTHYLINNQIQPIRSDIDSEIDEYIKSNYKHVPKSIEETLKDEIINDICKNNQPELDKYIKSNYKHVPKSIEETVKDEIIYDICVELNKNNQSELSELIKYLYPTNSFFKK